MREIRYIIYDVDCIDQLKRKINHMQLNPLFIAIENCSTVIITFDRHLTDNEEKLLYSR
jgi:hypothetical protein